jgi:hypothetical protein
MRTANDDGRDEGLFMVDCFSLAKRRNERFCASLFRKRTKRERFFCTVGQKSLNLPSQPEKG